MRRRELLKALATVPVASALGNCLQYRPTPTPTPSEKKIHTVQILLEGAFSVVLEKNKPNRLIAFVPRSDEESLDHDFFFNDPEMPEQAAKAARKASPMSWERWCPLLCWALPSSPCVKPAKA